MEGRRLNVSASAGGKVGVKRNAFDRHVNDCRDCQPSLCPTAQAMWRSTCLAALQAQSKGDQ